LEVVSVPAAKMVMNLVAHLLVTEPLTGVGVD